MAVFLQRNKRLLLAALLASITAIFYSGAMHCYFVLDDFVWLRGAVRANGIGSVIGPFVQFNGAGFYRPLTQEIYFLLNYRIFGLDPVGFHFSNLLVHLINSVLVFVLLIKLGRKDHSAWLGALFYGVNAAFFTSVAWISAITETGMAMFCLLAMICMADHCKSRNLFSYLLSIVFLLMALASKESAIALPLLLAMICLYLADRLDLKNIKSALWRAAPHTGIVVVYLLIRYFTIGFKSAGPYAAKINWQIPINIVRYAAWGLDRSDLLLSIIGHFHIHGARFIPFGLLILIGLTLVLMLFYRLRDTVFAGTWFLIALLPVMPIVNHAQTYYVNIASIGICILIASAVEACEWIWPPALWSAVAIVILAISGLNIRYEMKHSWVTDLGERARKGITSMIHQRPDLPDKAKLYLLGVDEKTGSAYGHSSIFQLFYNKNIPVIYTDNARRIKQGEGVFVFQYRDGELEDMTGKNLMAVRGGRTALDNCVLMTNDVDEGQLGRGWQRPEGEYRWIVKSAELLLANPDVNNEVHELIVTGMTRDRNGGKIRVTVLVDGVKAGEKVIGGKGYYNIRMPFRRKLAATCRVTFIVDGVEAASTTAGRNKENGIAVRSVKLDQ